MGYLFDMKSPEVVQAEMSKDIEHIKLDITDMKKAMEKMTESLDNLAEKWQEIGGLMNGLEHLNNRVNGQDNKYDELSKRVHELEMVRLKSESALKMLVVVGSIAGSIVGTVGTLWLKKFL